MRKWKPKVTDQESWKEEEIKLLGKGAFEDNGKEANVFLLPDGTVGMTDASSWKSKHGEFLHLPIDKILKTDEEEIYFNLFRYREWYIRLLPNGLYIARYSDGKKKKI